jgi:hypothetical protein
VQQRKLGAEVPGEGCGPSHDLPASGRVIHCGENAPGRLAHAAIDDERRDGQSSDQALESTAPAPVPSLASEHYNLRTKACGRLGKAIDWRADSHLYR